MMGDPPIVQQPQMQAPAPSILQGQPQAPPPIDPRAAFAPRAISPEETAYQEAMASYKPAKPPSTLASILAIATGGMSLVPGALKQSVENKNWQHGVEAKKIAAESAEKRAQQGISIGADISVDDWRNAQAENTRLKEENAKSLGNRKLELAAAKQKALEQNRKDRLDLDKLATQQRDPMAILDWLDASDVKEDPDDPDIQKTTKEERKRLWDEYKGKMTPDEKVALQNRMVQSKLDLLSSPDNVAKASSIAGNRSMAVAQGAIDVKTDPENIKKEQELMAAKDAVTRSQVSKGAAEKSKIALERYPDIMSQLNTASDKIFGNRWKDFQAGTLGKGAEEFEPLRLNIGLLQSLIAQIHVQRTGAVILQKFEGLFNAKQMDRKTLQNGLIEMKKWLEAYARNPNDPKLDKGVPTQVNAPGSTGGFDWSSIRRAK
jgi:hypothetical protein